MLFRAPRHQAEKPALFLFPSIKSRQLTAVSYDCEKDGSGKFLYQNLVFKNLYQVKRPSSFYQLMKYSRKSFRRTYTEKKKRKRIVSSPEYRPSFHDCLFVLNINGVTRPLLCFLILESKISRQIVPELNQKIGCHSKIDSLLRSDGQ